MDVVHILDGRIGTEPKLSDVLFTRQPPSFRTLIPMPSNVEALEAALQFGAGLYPFVAIAGPSGWGKSHLLAAVASRLSEERGQRVEVVSVERFLDPNFRIEASSPVIIDDMQESFARPRTRTMVKVALERRVRTNRPTLLAFSQPRFTRQMRALLPNGRVWSCAEMSLPQREERVLLVNHLANVMRLELSPALARIIAGHMHGNGRTLAGALNRLALMSPAWIEVEEQLRAVGILNAYFSDNPDWDLRLKVLHVADILKPLIPQCPPNDLSAYVLLRIARLPESDIARAMAANPSTVYRRARRFERLLGEVPSLQVDLRKFVQTVVDSLLDDVR